MRTFYTFCRYFLIFGILSSLSFCFSGKPLKYEPVQGVSIEHRRVLGGSLAYESHWINASDSVKLYQRSRLKKDAGCNVLFLHGMSFHSGQYEAFAKKVVKNSACSFHALDLRGFGKSGTPGDIDYTWMKASERVISDICSVMSLHLDAPLYLAGHSLGGAFAIKAAELCRIDLEGLILLAPGVEVQTPDSPEMQEMKACMFGNMIFSPDERLDSSMGWVDEVRNGPMGEMMRSDELSVIQMTYRFFMVFIGIQKGNLLKSAEKINFPVLLVQGKNDTVVNPDANSKFFDLLSSTDKEFLEIDASHALGGLFFSKSESFDTRPIFQFLQGGR